MNLEPLERLQGHLNEAERLLCAHIQNPHAASVDQERAAIDAHKAVEKAQKLVNEGLAQLSLPEETEEKLV